MPNHKLIRTVLLLGLAIGLGIVLYFGRTLLVPLAVAGLIAMLFTPLQEWLEQRGMGRAWSTAVCATLLVLFFAAIFVGLGSQIAAFGDDWPRIKQQASEKVTQLKDYLRGTPIVAASSDSEVVSMPELNGEQATDALGQVLGTLSDFLLMFVYVILLLLQRDRLREFVLRRVGTAQRKQANDTLANIVDVAQEYLRARLLLMLILAVIYGIGFSWLGLQNALFVAAFGALLSIIPYLGNVFAALLALGFALVTGGDTSMMLGILGVMGAAQVLESYVLQPIIVGQRVDLNPLFTILFVVALTLLWGPVGAIIAIPIGGILNVVFQRVEGLEDFAYLIGTESEDTSDKA